METAWVAMSTAVAEGEERRVLQVESIWRREAW
jgi:hypothetical protein